MQEDIIKIINETNAESLSEEEYRIMNIKRQIYEYNCFIKYLDIHVVELKSRVRRLEKMLRK